jgi:hypothetical protein
MDSGAAGHPRVTIGMPLFNAERYLEQAFDSLLAQDFADLEIVVCDNASTDRTWRICTRYAAADPRIRLYRNEVNRGAAYNYNRVAELARGELFRWAGYDDWCAPTLVSRCVAALDQAGPEVVLAYPRTVLIDDDGEPLGPYQDRMDLRDPRPWRRVAQVANRYNLCNPVFGLIRMTALRRTGLIRPYLSSDVTLLAELAALGRFHEVPEPLFHRRIHAGSSRQGRGTSRRALAEAAAWFDPRRRGPVWAPRTQLAVRTAIALWGDHNRLPATVRTACAAGFVTTRGVRWARARAGRARRAVLGRPVEPAWAPRARKEAGTTAE